MAVQANTNLTTDFAKAQSIVLPIALSMASRNCRNFSALPDVRQWRTVLSSKYTKTR